MLHLDYRPRSWPEFVGHEKQVARVRAVIDRPGYSGGAFWIDGPSGIGKSCLAELICHQFAHPFDVQRLDGDRCTVEAVRDLGRTLGYYGMYGPWQAVICDEAHAMSSRAVQAWLTLLERLPAKRLVVFTTTQTKKAQPDLFGDYRDPMLSRCVPISLSSYGVKDAFARRAQQVAQAAGLDGQPIEKYARLVQDACGNLREALSRIEAGEMVA